MFSKLTLSLGALALAVCAVAEPIPAFKDVLAKRGHSFNNYGGYGSLSNFDDFYGSEDFSGVRQKVVEEKEVVCHTERIEIIQQHLTVIREWYKKIITEQVCEVEIQTIVHHQHVSGYNEFSHDLRRVSDRHVSYDHEIASRIRDIHDSSSESVINDYGFHGSDIGSHSVHYSGDNWKSDSSPKIVDDAFNSAKSSYENSRH